MAAADLRSDEQKAIDAAIEQAVLRERERIASRLEDEAELSPCKEDGDVYRSAAWLVRGDFSYEEAERLQIAAEQGADSLSA